MFYCQHCATKNKWPDDFYLAQSVGACEVCKKTAVCFDVPSSHLPSPKVVKRKRVSAHGKAMKTVKVPSSWERDFNDSNATNFRALLFRMIQKADAENLRRLAKGFPVEVKAYMVQMNCGRFPTEVEVEEIP